MEHRELTDMQDAIKEIRAAPSERGRVALIVRRPEVNAREVVAQATLDEHDGLVGDCWRTRGSHATPDGSAHPETQITLMNARAAACVAGEPERWPLAGDQFYVDFDLSVANLPAGTRVTLGDALLEITAEPHRGCSKFAKRFGVDALKFVNSAVGRELNLRGVHARVLRGGVVGTGDEIARA